jgi:hypothetical protein
MSEKRYAIAVYPVTNRFPGTDTENPADSWDWVRRADLVLVQHGEDWRVLKSRDITYQKGDILDFLDMVARLAEAFGVDLAEPPSEKAARNLEKSQIVAETPTP